MSSNYVVSVSDLRSIGPPSGFELGLEGTRPVTRACSQPRRMRARYGLVIRPSRSGFFFLGHLSHQSFCGEHETRDRSRILERVAGHLRWIDDARFHQVDILAGGNVVAFVP